MVPDESIGAPKYEFPVMFLILNYVFSNTFGIQLNFGTYY